MKVVFEINTEQLKELEKKIAQLPNEAEKVINDYLHSEGAELGITAIKKEMPKSNRKKRAKGQPRTHAKESDSLDFIKRNLGFVVKSKKRFNYLVFPAMGLGTSYRKKPNDFMNRGLNKIVPTVISELEKKIIKRMEEKL